MDYSLSTADRYPSRTLRKARTCTLTFKSQPEMSFSGESPMDDGTNLKSTNVTAEHDAAARSFGTISVGEGSMTQAELAYAGWQGEPIGVEVITGLILLLQIAPSLRLSRVACQNGLRRLAEFELAVTGLCGLACGLDLLALGYTTSPH
ncbi:hypothetical protein C8R45DRAFT_937285 [Mycena sanguinolenta]|nr:hypothetical protein C8R45DRAFT_937285 [Mycena sanguinolenta]